MAFFHVTQKVMTNKYCRRYNMYTIRINKEEDTDKYSALLLIPPEALWLGSEEETNGSSKTIFLQAIENIANVRISELLKCAITFQNRTITALQFMCYIIPLFGEEKKFTLEFRSENLWIQMCHRKGSSLFTGSTSWIKFSTLPTMVEYADVDDNQIMDLVK
jgi:hypothetical protein